MKTLLHFCLLSALACMFGCASQQKVSVFDSETQKPISDAFVITTEYNKSFLNKSGLYLTNDGGEVLINESGSMNVFAGKEGYSVGMSLGHEEDEVKTVFLTKDGKIDEANKITRIHLRDNLVADHNFDSTPLLKRFKEYCDQQKTNIVFDTKSPWLIDTAVGVDD